MFKRAWLSITRRKFKSILLFVILFVVANLVITTIAIKNATNEATDFAKESIGSEVTLSADMKSMRENLISNTSSETETSDSATKTEMSMPEVSIEDALKIADSKYISGYSYGFTAAANLEDLEAVESEMEKMGDISMDNSKATNSGTSEGSKREMPSGNMQFNFSMKDIRSKLVSGDVTIEAINSWNNLSNVSNGTLELTYGTAFSSEDENVAIISYDFAELNSLKIGDSITLKHTESEENIIVKVVGIYENSASEGNNMMMNSSNTIYTNLVTGEKFMTEEAYNEGNYTISSCLYYLTDPNYYDAFVEEASSKVDLDSKYLKLSIDQTTYDQMVGSIESIGSFASVILGVVIIASVVLIALVINGQIKERHYEMGVLLSLGENKKRIVGQILIELIIIATVAFLISMLTGSLIAGAIGNSLSTSQTSLKTEQAEMMVGRGQMGKPSSQNTSTKIDVNVGIRECAVLVSIGYLIVIFAMVIPAISIFKYNPKTILSRRE